MKSHFATLFFGLFIVFVGWIALGGTPQERMARSCEWMRWGGRFATSVTELFLPQYAPNVAGTFNNGFYNCQYVLWKQFYEASYLEAVERAKVKAGEAAKAVAGK